MISRRKFLGTTAMAAVAATLGLPFAATPVLAAPQNPQRISRGWPFAVYIDGTGTSQSMTHHVYVNQTQFTPPAASNSSLLLMGVGN